MSDLLRDAVLGRRQLPDPARSGTAHRRARILQGLLVIYGLSLVAGVGAGAVAPGTLDVAAGALVGAAFVLTGVMFMLWTHTMYTLVPALTGTETEYPAWWAWAGYIIPIANLFRPYQVVAEIRDATDPAELHTGWAAPRARLPLGVWWGLWIASSVVERIFNRVPEPGPLEDDALFAGLAVLTVVLLLGATVTAFLVVRQTDAALAETERLLADALAARAAEAVRTEPAGGPPAFPSISR